MALEKLVTVVGKEVGKAGKQVVKQSKSAIKKAAAEQKKADAAEKKRALKAAADTASLRAQEQMVKVDKATKASGGPAITPSVKGGTTGGFKDPQLIQLEKEYARAKNINKEAAAQLKNQIDNFGKVTPAKAKPAPAQQAASGKKAKPAAAGKTAGVKPTDVKSTGVKATGSKAAAKPSKAKVEDAAETTRLAKVKENTDLKRNKSLATKEAKAEAKKATSAAQAKPAAKLTETPKPSKEKITKTKRKKGTTSPGSPSRPIDIPVTPGPKASFMLGEDDVIPTRNTIPDFITDEELLLPPVRPSNFLRDTDVAPPIGQFGDAPPVNITTPKAAGAISGTEAIVDETIAPAAGKISLLGRLRNKKAKLPKEEKPPKSFGKTKKAAKAAVGLTALGGTFYGLGKLIRDGAPTEAAATGEVEAVLGAPLLPTPGDTGDTGGIGGGTNGGIGGDGGSYPAGSDAALVESIVQDALGKLQSGNGTKEDADVIAEAGSNELDNSVDNALQGLIDAYGSPEAIEDGVAQQDPLLLQQLAGIEADYQAGLAQIKEGYAAALQLVGGYQNEANALLADSTKNMAASFEAASMGMQGMGMSSGIPEYTALEGGISGISDTALGGAGITGAALGRGMSGAAQAQGLVQQLELGTTLGGQRAEGALSQADLEAALAREALGAKTGARTDSAERLSAERLAREEQARLDSQRIAEFKYNRALQLEEVARNEQATEEERRQAILELQAQAQIDLANKVVGMSAEERRAFLGQTGTAAGTPSWYGTRIQGPANSGIKGLLSSDGTKVPITVNTANRALDMLDAALQDTEARGPKALTYWSNFYNTIGPDAIKIYGSVGRPDTATKMVQQLG